MPEHASGTQWDVAAPNLAIQLSAVPVRKRMTDSALRFSAGERSRSIMP